MYVFRKHERVFLQPQLIRAKKLKAKAINAAGNFFIHKYYTGKIILLSGVHRVVKLRIASQKFALAEQVVT